ncbi:NADH-quinone oxidoreductase subunit NuoE [Halapricum hydrolyticum]|uniref:NADH-quinone oxidoreductase subunit NuoE n=1 Tax=Halapricum hydrolyticum TaxID=2979991 RepID=A0AAE3IAQ0_9EURY|nr:NADH-quinone oxidoreductase subunit NuoE [Halapricum hydrolyticum]MCU4717507.1 NADH-quinone oxidoreductase subunit NuoE [Halapricum hydrolyticum]MCU4726671.1 NADH-quinone oxidoreductase subunit NuoE [Halapricum hydrolyticum]
MASLDSIRQSIHESDADVGGDDAEIIPADADVEDVCDEEVDTVRSLIEPFPDDKEGVIPALQEVQGEYGYLPRFSMQLIADKAGTSMAHVYGTASFYSQFYLEPRGEHTIKVCTGTACHVKGADEISEEFCDELDVELEEVTDDGQFTVSHVRCIGACSLAPAVMVGDNVHGNVTEEKVPDVIEEYRGDDA